MGLMTDESNERLTHVDSKYAAEELS